MLVVLCSSATVVVPRTSDGVSVSQASSCLDLFQRWRALPAFSNLSRPIPSRRAFLRVEFEEQL